MAEVSRLGRRLKQFRERAGLSQHELARLSGVSRSAIAGVETGDRGDLSLANTIRIADALGITIDALARGDVLDAELTAAIA
jgi:transcriptional regulator with XRE-family HTH domain